MVSHWGILLLSFAAFWGRQGVLCICSYCWCFLSRKACLHSFCTLFFWTCGDPSILQLWLFPLVLPIVTPALWSGLSQSAHGLSGTEVLHANRKILFISPLGKGILCAFKKKMYPSTVRSWMRKGTLKQRSGDTAGHSVCEPPGVDFLSWSWDSEAGITFHCFA